MKWKIAFIDDLPGPMLEKFEPYLLSLYDRELIDYFNPRNMWEAWEQIKSLSSIHLVFLDAKLDFLEKEGDTNILEKLNKEEIGKVEKILNHDILNHPFSSWQGLLTVQDILTNGGLYLYALIQRQFKNLTDTQKPLVTLYSASRDIRQRYFPFAYGGLLELAHKNEIDKDLFNKKLEIIQRQHLNELKIDELIKKINSLEESAKDYYKKTFYTKTEDDSNTEARCDYQQKLKDTIFNDCDIGNGWKFKTYFPQYYSEIQAKWASLEHIINKSFPNLKDILYSIDYTLELMEYFDDPILVILIHPDDPHSKKAIKRKGLAYFSDRAIELFEKKITFKDHPALKKLFDGIDSLTDKDSNKNTLLADYKTGASCWRINHLQNSIKTAYNNYIKNYAESKQNVKFTDIAGLINNPKHNALYQYYTWMRAEDSCDKTSEHQLAELIDYIISEAIKANPDKSDFTINANLAIQPYQYPYSKIIFEIWDNGRVFSNLKEVFPSGSNRTDGSHTFLTCINKFRNWIDLEILTNGMIFRPYKNGDMRCEQDSTEQDWGTKYRIGIKCRGGT